MIIGAVVGSAVFHGEGEKKMECLKGKRVINWMYINAEKMAWQKGKGFDFI